MRVYHAFSGAEFNPGAAKTAICAIAAAGRGFKVKRFWMTFATTTSAVVEALIQRYTAQGTGTAATVSPLDPNDAAFSGTEVEYNYTVEPTPGTDLWVGHTNLTVPFDLVLPPGDEIWVPGAVNQGVGIYLVDNPNVMMHVGMVIEEP